jgi:hypothetical protein
MQALCGMKERKDAGSHVTINNNGIVPEHLPGGQCWRSLVIASLNKPRGDDIVGAQCGPG